MAKRWVQAVGIEDVGTDDEVVGGRFMPVGPIGSALLESCAIAFGISAANDEGGSVLVGLHDVGTKCRGDDAGQAGPCSELEDAGAFYGALGELVRKRNGGGPQRDAVGQARLITSQEVIFVLVAEDGTGMEDRPGMATEREAVLLEG